MAEPGRRPLAGQVVLVTGAARGIGAGLARALAARGARLALIGLDAARLAALAAELGGDTAWWEADVTDEVALATAFTGAAERFGRIDVVVANAGITAFGPLAELPAETFERVLAVNLVGAYRTMRLAVPHLRASKGYLLVVSSMSAAIHSPMQGHYTASKAGLWAMADSMRLEERPHGVRVGIAHPTFVATDLMTQTHADPIGRRLWRGNRGFWGMVSLDQAVDALVGAVEGRPRRVVVPRRLLPVLLAPGVFQPLAELWFRPRRVRRLLAQARAEASGRGEG